MVQVAHQRIGDDLSIRLFLHSALWLDLIAFLIFLLRPLLAVHYTRNSVLMLQQHIPPARHPGILIQCIM
jgi:hypothetical protein